jgi:hypothetical protein
MSYGQLVPLIAAYCQAIDDGRTDDSGTLFSDQGRLCVPIMNKILIGPRQIADFNRSLINPGIKSMHCAVNPVLAIDGDHASGSFDLFTIHFHLAPPRIVSTARCECQFRLTTNGWKIAELIFNIHELKNPNAP